MGKNRFYNDAKFLGSMSGRPLRVLSEYLGPLSILQRNKIVDTIVFFGSARFKSTDSYYKKAKVKKIKFQINCNKRNREFSSKK